MLRRDARSRYPLIWQFLAGRHIGLRPTIAIPLLSSLYCMVSPNPTLTTHPIFPQTKCLHTTFQLKVCNDFFDICPTISPEIPVRFIGKTLSDGSNDCRIVFQIVLIDLIVSIRFRMVIFTVIIDIMFPD